MPINIGTGNVDAIKLGTTTVDAVYQGTSKVYPPVGPAITTQPTDQSAANGATATYTVAATGTGTLTYQWQRNGANIGGATGTSYTTPAVDYAANNGDDYRCIVTDQYGQATTSNSASLTVTVPALTISILPTAPSVIEGDVINYTSSVGGGYGAKAYQWRLDGADISGATGSTYDRTTVLADNGKAITCRVTDAASQATVSNSSTMTVAVLSGEQIFTSSGTFVVPAGVTSVSVVGVQSGFNGVDTASGGGGRGGSLGYSNNLPVTPGESIAVTTGGAGSNGAPATFRDDTTFKVGSNLAQSVCDVLGEGGTQGFGDSGGSWGVGGAGGGAGGYGAKGGNGGTGTGISGTPTAGTDGANGGGGGGGGGKAPSSGYVGGGVGGGVGIFGQGANGSGGAAALTGSNGGNGGAGSGGSGQTYGGGGRTSLNAGTNGAGGAVRIIWGNGRAFPSTDVGPS